MDIEKNDINHLTQENYKQQIEVWYKANNISREKLELFHDFMFSLYEIIDGTYLGSDVLYLENDQRGHFNWCWNQLISSFEKEKIYFKNSGNIYEYLWNFFFESYYFMMIENKTPKVSNYIAKLFDFTYVKTRSELDVVNEIYKLFNQNLKK
jgi:hypothetical protein